MNDDDQENNGEAKTDNDDNDDESEDGVFGLTTVIDLKKHKVNERERVFFKFFIDCFILRSRKLCNVIYYRYEKICLQNVVVCKIF